jgi:hypothetical protein
VVVTRHVAFQDIRKAKGSALSDLVLEDGLHFLIDFRVLGGRGLVVILFEVNVSILGPINNNFDFDSVGFYVLDGVSTHYQEENAEDHRDKDSEDV